MPPERRHHRDRYKPYRRPNLTPSERPSPFTYVDTLYETVRKPLGKKVQEQIENDVQEFLNMISPDPLVRSTGDNVSCIPPLHWHPKTLVESGLDMAYVLESAMDAAHPRETRKAAEQVISYWTAANSLKLLHRFVDARQPQLLQVPLPDGSNIPDNVREDPKKSLELEWKFRRIFIRCLHLPGLWFTGEAPAERYRALGRLYGIARCLLELELMRCPEVSNSELVDNYLVPINDPEAEPFWWMGESRRIIIDILDEVAEVAFEDHKNLRAQFFPKSGPELTSDEIFERNLTPQYIHVMLDEMIKKYNERMSKHPFERLVMDLMEKEDTFERLLSQEHIEDTLIHKQIVPFDELDITGGPEQSAYEIGDSYTEKEGTVATGKLLENFIYKIAPGISLVNRQRRNFRLTREWVNERSWFRLFHLYDPDIPGNEWQAEAIETFCKYHSLRARPNIDPFVPSHPVNVLPNLFGIEPWVIGEKNSSGADMSFCNLCRKRAKGGNGPSNTMVVLDCVDSYHVFHAGCLLDFWDEEGKYTHDCPKCGATPSLTHVRLGMYPDPDDPYFNTAHPTFVDNAFGWIPRPPEPGEPPDLSTYDVPEFYETDHQYWQRENFLVANVVTAQVAWDRREMTPNLTADEESGDPNFNRMVRDLGHRWRLRNLDLTTAEDYVMEDAFESARFAPSEEVAWLRMTRRARNRNRRRRIEDAGDGMIRYMPWSGLR